LSEKVAVEAQVLFPGLFLVLLLKRSLKDLNTFLLKSGSCFYEIIMATNLEWGAPMLAEKKYKVKFGSNPNGNNWINGASFER